MKKEDYLLLFAIISLFSHLLQLGEAIEIGFGQPSDASREGEAKQLPIRFRGTSIPVSVSIAGYVKPYTYAEYDSINLDRNIMSTAVLAAIENIQDKDSPEHNDLSFNEVNFTITDTSADNFINMSSIIYTDDIHEAEEHFILVMNITDTGGLELGYDDEGGVIVYTILDNNPIGLVLSINSQTNFSESHGSLEGIISVERGNYFTVPSEVDLPVRVIISNGDATAGEDFVSLTNYTHTYIIGKDDRSIFINPINITNDDIPETIESFGIAITESDIEVLNIFPSDEIIEITIEDDDVAKVVFTQSVYTVTKGDEAYVEVCITLDNGVSLYSSSAYGTFNISTRMGSAMQGDDYDPTPSPVTVTLMRGQNVACTNITIIDIDDMVAEENKVFDVTVVEVSNNFSLGVDILMNTSTVTIIDDDEVVVSMSFTTTSLSEGTQTTITVFYNSMDVTIGDGMALTGMINLRAVTADTSDYRLSSGNTFSLTSTTLSEQIAIDAIDDNLFEELQETFVAELVLQPTPNVLHSISTPSQTLTINDNDFVEVSFAMETYAFEEGEGVNWQVMVEISNGVQFPVGVDIDFTVSVVPETNASDPSDYEFNMQLPAVLSLGQSTGQMFTMYINLNNDDELVEGLEVVTLMLSNPDTMALNRDNDVIFTPYGTSIIKIYDNDEIVVGFNTTTSDSSGVEGESVTVCIQILEGILAPNVTLSYLIGAPREASSPPQQVDLPDDTAIATTNSTEGDYQPISFRVSLNRNYESECTTISIVDDDIVEDPEIFVVQVEQVVSSDDLRFTLNPEYINITIIDNDGYQQSVSVFISSGTPNYLKSTVMLYPQSTTVTTSPSNMPNNPKNTITSTSQSLEATAYVSIVLGLLLFIVLLINSILSIVFWVRWSRKRRGKSSMSENPDYEVVSNSTGIIGNLTYNSDLRHNRGPEQNPMELNENVAYRTTLNREMTAQYLQQTETRATDNNTQQDRDPSTAEDEYEYMN